MSATTRRRGPAPGEGGRPRGVPEPANQQLAGELAEAAAAVRQMDDDREELERARVRLVARIAKLDVEREKLVKERDAILSAIRMHNADRTSRVAERNRLVRQALEEGWSHTQVARKAGHTRGWVSVVVSSPT